MIPRHKHPAYKEWAADKVAGLPFRWKKRLLKKWEATRNAFDAAIGTAEGDATRAAAHWLAGVMDGLRTVHVPLNASDDDICARADEMSEYCNSLASVFHDKASLRDAMARVCTANHIQAPNDKKTTDSSAIARMVCAQWWRRQLRRLQTKAVEGAAISIGYVNKTRDIYVSDESLERRIGQKRRNAAMMESTTATNELEQEYKLAELAATGISNPEIKRCELMTRIAGFEVIAKDCDHEGLFMTVTAPSRMHKWRTINGGKVVENRKYDGTLPDAAQKHLGAVGARFRAQLARYGVKVYGFRIAEPNHDGTPHWHWLVFFPKQWPGMPGRASYPRVCAVMRRYALGKGEVKTPLKKDLVADVLRQWNFTKKSDAKALTEVELHKWRVADRQRQNAERGAKKHRVDFERIDWKIGSAAAYIAKYVSKNIDGYKVDTDLFGNPMFSVSRRVEAWAASWHIRQFQQIGGAPVTPWRELRRVKALPDGAPEHLERAHLACNKIEDLEAGEVKPVSWSEYQIAQGGVFCGREYLIKIAKESRAGTNRYGEPLPPLNVGLETVGPKRIIDGICDYVVPSFNWLIKSVRHVWTIIRRASSETTANAVRAWTRVNNCTPQNPHWSGASDFSIMSDVSTSEKCRNEWDLSRRYDDAGLLISSKPQMKYPNAFPAMPDRATIVDFGGAISA